jgi:uncharacterized delta-60 repeat protein
MRRTSRRISFLIPTLTLTLLLAPSAARAAAGDLDTRFGSGGVVQTNFAPGDSDYAFAVALQADGKIVVAGQTGVYPDLHSALARYTRNGGLDRTFGTNGKVSPVFDAEGDQLSAVAIQADGKIVAAGSLIANNFPQAFLLARFNADGSLDTTFGTNGMVTTTFGDSTASGHDVVVQVDGKILEVGVSGAGPYSELNDFALARFNADGTPDASFGSGGQLTTHFSGQFNTGTTASAAVLQGDGKVVVVGTYKNEGTPHEFALARYGTDGSLDPTFGSGGKVTTSIGSGDAIGAAVALQADGKILVSGYSTTTQDHDFTVARYGTNGTLDSSFGTGGVVTTNFTTNSSDIAYAVTVQRDGKIVAAGRTGDYPAFDLALTRYTSAGVLDSTFGTGGKVTTNLGNQEQGYAAVVDSKGKIVLAGISFANGSNFDMVVARYLGR